MTQNLKIETWPLDRLILYARNARLHSEAQVAQIAASIAEFGFNNPVLVDPQGGIIAGHARVLAARKLGYAEMPQSASAISPRIRSARSSWPTINWRSTPAGTWNCSGSNWKRWRRRTSIWS